MSPGNAALPVLALLYSAAFWGIVWYPLRLLETAGLSGPWQALVSFLAAALALLPFARIRLGAVRSHAVGLLWLAIASGWANMAFILAMLDGTVVRVLLLFYLAPLWQTLLARWLLGEHIDRGTVGILSIGLSRAVVMLWDPQLDFRWLSERTDWLALSAGVAFALNNVMARRVQGVNVATKTLIAWSGVVVFALVVVLAQGCHWPQLPLSTWTGAAVLGLVGFLFATLMAVYGVTNMPAQRSAMIMLFEIVVGALTAWWLAGEQLMWREWFGGVLIVTAGVLAATRRRPAAAPA